MDTKQLLLLLLLGLFNQPSLFMAFPCWTESRCCGCQLCYGSFPLRSITALSWWLSVIFAQHHGCELMCIDFSVLIGARRTSWDVGRSVNGTHLLLSVARGLSRLFHNADNLWLPKYTVRLVSWGGADVGDRGISEFIEVSCFTSQL